MQRAIEDVQSGRLSYMKAAKFHKVPVGTLHRLAKSDIPASQVITTLGRKPVLSKAIEESLVDYLLVLDRNFFGMTRSDLRRMAYQLAVANELNHPFNDGESAGKLLYFISLKCDR